MDFVVGFVFFVVSNHCCRLIISPIVLSTTGQHDVRILGFMFTSSIELFSKIKRARVKSFQKKLLT